MTQDLVIVGAGGLGRETLDVADAAIAAGAPYRVLGVLDSDPSEANLSRLRERGASYLGTEAGWLAGARAGASYVIGVGSPAVRRRIAERFDAAGISAATLIHPSAVIGSQVSFGAGSVVCGGVQVTTNVTAGRHVLLNLNVTVGHDVRIEDYVAVNPGAAISGDVVLESGVLVGVGAVILQGLRVGAGATVGGAACVVRDVDAGIVVKGVPAR